MKKYLFLVLGLDFAALTLYALFQQNMLSYIGNAGQQPWGLHTLIELLLLLSLGGVWMYKDAKKQNIAATPFFILFALSGVAGIFFYLCKKEFLREQQIESSSRQQASM